MRSRIIEYLNSLTGTGIFEWIIPSSSVIHAIAFILVVVVFAARCKRSGLEKGIALDIGIWAGLGGLVFTRLFYLAFSQNGFDLGIKSLFSAGGTASWGVYLGAFIGAYLCLKYKRRPVLPYMDVLATALPLGTFIGRWSCFMHGCDYGTITNVPWAVQYPFGSLAHAAHFNDSLIPPDALMSLPVHPNQIYLSLNGLLIFIIVTRFWKKYHSAPGLTLGFYVLLYCSTRFLIEYFRDAAGTGIVPVLNPPQLVCAIGGVLSVLFCIYVLKYQKLSLETCKNSNIKGSMGEKEHV